MVIMVFILVFVSFFSIFWGFLVLFVMFIMILPARFLFPLTMVTGLAWMRAAAWYLGIFSSRSMTFFIVCGFLWLR